jgi:hypothetical protein
MQIVSLALLQVPDGTKVRKAFVRIKALQGQSPLQGRSRCQQCWKLRSLLVEMLD